MHYCVMLITKSIPNYTEIEKIMSKYSWDNIQHDENDTIIGELPVFTYDWYVIGGRYGGVIKLKVDDSDKEYQWGYYAREDRNNRLFISSILNDLKESLKPVWKYSEEKFLLYMGYRDNILRVDGAKIKDIANRDELGCYICIKPDGEAVARSIWNGKGFVDNENFNEEFKQIINDNMDGFLTVLDIHD